MSEEEEVQLINKLQQEISDLAQQAGISLVQHQRWLIKLLVRQKEELIKFLSI